MLEMLRALAQSEASAFPELGHIIADRDDAPRHGEGARSETIDAPADASFDTGPSTGAGLMLLRAQLFGGEPDDTELQCRYCNRTFRLAQGGASFEGSVACAGCEQHLNRDVVLPAVSKNRPHACEPARPEKDADEETDAVHTPAIDSEDDAGLPAAAAFTSDEPALVQTV